MRILGLPKDTLVSLKERRDKLTVAEFKRIKEDASNPNNKFIPIPLDNNFNLRSFVQYKPTTSENQPIVFLQICCVWPAWLNKFLSKFK